MSSGSACWILWLTPMDWLALSIGRSGSQPLEYSYHFIISIHPKRKILLENKLTYASFILNDVGLKIEKIGFQCLGIIHVGFIENLFNKGIIDYEENVHIHFVVNSVSFIDGHKLVRIYTLLNSIIVFLKSDYPYLNWDSKIYVK